jgi:hypothetical protein
LLTSIHKSLAGEDTKDWSGQHFISRCKCSFILYLSSLTTEAKLHKVQRLQQLSSICGTIQSTNNFKNLIRAYIFWLQYN